MREGVSAAVDMLPPEACRAGDDEGAHAGCQSDLRPRDTPLGRWAHSPQSIELSRDFGNFALVFLVMSVELTWVWGI